MSSEVTDKVKELTNWCIDNHEADGFCVFIDFQGHVNQISVHGYFDGWDRGKERSFDFGAYINEMDSDIYIDEILTELEQIKSEYDKLNTPEEKQKRIKTENEKEKARLIARLAELDN